MKGWDVRPGFKPWPSSSRGDYMICVICGKKAKYNEKLNIYYCEEHGLTTWLEDIDHSEINIEAKRNAEAVLG